MQEWVVSATAGNQADQETAADVRRFLESRGALAVFVATLGAGVLRVAFRWPAPSRERAERDAAAMLQSALAASGKGRPQVRAIAR